MAEGPGERQVGWLAGWVSLARRPPGSLPLRRLRPGVGPFLDQPSSKAPWRTQNDKCHKYLISPPDPPHFGPPEYANLRIKTLSAAISPRALAVPLAVRWLYV